MNANDLIRELSALEPIDRTLEVVGAEYVKVLPGHCIEIGEAPVGDEEGVEVAWADGNAAGVAEGHIDGRAEALMEVAYLLDEAEEPVPAIRKLVNDG